MFLLLSNGEDPELLTYECWYEENMRLTTEKITYSMVLQYKISQSTYGHIHINSE